MAENRIEASVLADLWFRWIAVVKRTVDPHAGGPKTAAKDYRQLHISLTNACKQWAATDEELHAKAQDIRRLIAPWVNHESLTTADHRFLNDLIKQAEPISATLRKYVAGSTKKKVAARKSKPLRTWLIAFAVGLAFGMFILMGDATSDMAWRHEFDRVMYRAKYKVAQFSFLQIFGAVTVLILLIVGPLMYTTRKS